MREVVIRIVAALIVYLAVWLPIAVLSYRERKRFVDQMEEQHYILRQPRSVFFISIVSIIFLLIFFTATVILSNEWYGLICLPLCAGVVFLVIYAIQWKIIVRDDQLEIFDLGKRPVTISIHEIERVEMDVGGINVYIGDKAVFSIGEWVIGFELLYNRLYELGKMEVTLLKNKFNVRHSKAAPIVGIIGIICITALLLWMRLCYDDSTEFGVYVFFLLFIPALILITIGSLRWKIKVEGEFMTYQTSFGQAKTIPLKSVEKVIVKAYYYHLKSNGKTIIKVESTYKGSEILFSRMADEGIPFYQKNKLINFQ